MEDRKAARQRRLAESKRQIILDAAREAFAEDGLERASLRAIATKAGYTPAALYFHFPSKEAIYAELLRSSLLSLGESVAAAVEGADTAEARFHAAGMGFFGYYAKHPSELDLGFYLFRGGMKPAGLDRETDGELNVALEAALRPLAKAARDMGAGEEAAELSMVNIFAHATGLLLLLHTGRIRMFGASAEALMGQYVEQQVAVLKA
ncbi:transcriptional regulator [Roseovarius sp. HI0049]|nr:transcriptional regulator [Roseovarius sp. HI0049]